MLEEKRPGLTITEKPGGLLHKQLIDYDGSVLLDETVFPHDDLIRFMHRPLKEYNQRLTNLEQHPLFEESLDIYIPDFEDFIEQCFAVVDSLQSEYPEAYFLIRIASSLALRAYNSFKTSSSSSSIIFNNSSNVVKPSSTLFIPSCNNEITPLL